MKRILIVITATGVLRSIGLAVILAVFVSAGGNRKEEAVCHTTECAKTAARILKNINPAVKPCDNFYEFACGGYLTSAPIPEGEISVNPSASLREDIKNQLKLVIEEPSSPTEARPFKLAKAFYRTCMDTSALENAGLEPLRKVLRQLGGWPVIEADSWKEEHFNWVKSTYTSRELRGYVSESFIGLAIKADQRNKTNYILHLVQPDYGLSREFLIEGAKNFNVKAYFDYMVDVAVILGANKRQATQELEEALEFEIKLANIGLPYKERRNYNNRTPMTITQLNNEYPFVNWEEYLNKMLPSSIHVNTDEFVLVSDPKFLRNLEKLLKDTPKKVQANYALWKVVAEAVKYLNKDLKNRVMKYISTTRGNIKTTSLPRWKECLAIISDSALSLSTNALYVRKYFKESERQNVIEMATDIKNELIRSLEKVEWMDETTRRRAIEKAVSMAGIFGSPVEFFDDNKLDELYANVTLRSNDFLGNYFELKKLMFTYTLELLRRPVNRTYWLFYDFSTLGDVFYDPATNSIYLPAGVSQGTFFGSERPRYLNYGAMGLLIGHESTHSYSNQGRRYDKDGNLVDWWTPETAGKYAQKSQCIIDQYNNYTVESVGRKVDGANTFEENIADNSGVKKAYLAYKKYVKRNRPEPKLPGLEYTPEQMFWISAANIWCSRYRPESAQYEPTTNDHSSARFRVIGSFANMPEFAADFNCPTGSYMNPVHKCSVF